MISSKGSSENRKWNDVSLSKAVSHALRHEPWLYELELDDAGWTEIEALLSALRKERQEWRELCADDLAQMMAASSKQRYEIQDNRIRAFYGHSIDGKLKKTPAAPPEVLYHGTNPAVIELIRSNGLLPMKRQFVHLSSDQATALEVGRRKCPSPIILQV